MKFLFLNAYFEPETTACTHLDHDMIDGLVEAGHEIEIISPTPTRGITDEIYKEYRSKFHEEMWGGNVRITRFRAPREGRNPIFRALRYTWCTSREKAIAKKFHGVDAVFASSTPPTQGKMAGEVAKKLGVPFLFSLQDIFPDSLVTTGLAKEGSFFYNIGTKIANRTYELADKIVVISDSFVENIRKKGVPEEKIVKIPNWTDTDAIRPVPNEENRLFDEFGISRDKFTVVYAGNLGEAQGADVIVRAAKLLRDNDNIQFVIFGGGARYEGIKAEVESIGLTNVIINPLLPQDRVSEVYSLGDVALITCKKGVGSSGMPSKTWSIMACNTPIIAAFDTDSELASILEEAGAGFAIEPECERALADAILYAVANGIESHGRDYAVANMSRSTCVGAYVRLFEELVSGGIRSAETSESVTL